ncbi:hypothetical protein WEH80_18775 [Actinomycetes bacterium KLBMP 9759]
MIESPQAFGLASGEVHDLVAAAGRAPAWPDEPTPLLRLRLRPDVVEVRAVSPGREQRIAGGAALFTMRLALLGFGIRPLVTILPDRGDPTVLARIRNGGHQRPTAEHRWLSNALTEERAATGNGAGRGAHVASCGDEPTSRPEQAVLRRAAVEEGCWLDFLVEGDQPCGGLVAALTAQLDGQPAQVRAGQAMQRVRLSAMAEGLTATRLFDPVRLSRTHDELRRRFVRNRAPLVVLRIVRNHVVRVGPDRSSCGPTTGGASSTAAAADRHVRAGPPTCDERTSAVVCAASTARTVGGILPTTRRDPRDHHRIRDEHAASDPGG